jgi:hypothetical protein
LVLKMMIMMMTDVVEVLEDEMVVQEFFSVDELPLVSEVFLTSIVRLYWD